jgi:polyhydroxyalkanoate synthesis regulator phasin
MPIAEDADLANKANNIRDICRRLESVYTKIQENNDKIQRLRRQIAELSAANAGLENKATDLLGKLPR